MGGNPPVLKSANLDGSDEYNALVIGRYAKIIPGVFGV
jgi:uncharacterized phosphosugar-binding protein